MKYDIHGPCTRKFKAATPPTRPNSEGRKRVDMLWKPVTQNACENQLMDGIGTLLVVENVNPVCDADRYLDAPKTTAAQHSNALQRATGMAR